MRSRQESQGVGPETMQNLQCQIHLHEARFEILKKMTKKKKEKLRGGDLKKEIKRTNKLTKKKISSDATQILQIFFFPNLLSIAVTKQKKKSSAKHLHNYVNIKCLQACVCPRSY